MNHITIHGRVCRDLELKKTNSDVSYCNFSVAVDRKGSKQGEEKQTDFFDCVAWRGLAEVIAKYFTKGKEIALSGSMESSKYEKDGVKRVSWKINVNDFDFCGGKSESGDSNSAPSYSSNSSGYETVADDEDLPF